MSRSTRRRFLEQSMFATAATMAVQAGKDVYVEKPVSHNV